MNKERFHIELALRLGYERIVKDKSLNISIDDCGDEDDLWVKITDAGGNKIKMFKASEAEYFFWN